MVPETAVWTQSFPYFKIERPKYISVFSAEEREDLTLIIRGNCKKVLDEIMTYREISHPSVYMSFDRCHDLSSLLHKDMKEITPKRSTWRCYDDVDCKARDRNLSISHRSFLYIHRRHENRPNCVFSVIHCCWNRKVTLPKSFGFLREWDSNKGTLV